MELTYVTIAVLASMIFVLAGMVGYLYWQQTHMLQHIQSLALAMSSLSVHQQTQPEVPHESQEHQQEEDDRVSVEHVEGPPPQEKTPSATTSVDEVDVDDLSSKTASELRELLTQKGIPFGKRDSKSVLIELLKATT